MAAIRLSLKTASHYSKVKVTLSLRIVTTLTDCSQRKWLTVIFFWLRKLAASSRVCNTVTCYVVLCVEWNLLPNVPDNSQVLNKSDHKLSTKFLKQSKRKQCRPPEWKHFVRFNFIRVIYHAMAHLPSIRAQILNKMIIAQMLPYFMKQLLNILWKYCSVRSHYIIAKSSCSNVTKLH